MPTFEQIIAGALGGPLGYGAAGGFGELPGAGDVVDWLGQSANNLNQQDLPYFEEDRTRLGGYLQGQSPFMTGQYANPYAGDFGALISQLRNQASGQGPSLAGMQYQRGIDQARAGQLAQARSAAPGVSGALAHRQAALNNARIGQGAASGMAQAQLQERLGAAGALAGVLGGASQADLGYQGLNANQARANQLAFLDILAKQLGLSSDQLRGQLGQPLEPGPANYERLINSLSQGGGFIAGL